MDWTQFRCSAAWAAKRHARLSAVFGETTYRDLEAVVLWGLGAQAHDLQVWRGLGRSSLYEHVTEVLTAPPGVPPVTAAAPPAPPPEPLPPTLAARVVELLVGQQLTPTEIVQRLAAQDGTTLPVAAVQAYLQHAGLTDYTGSAFREQAVPAAAPPLPGTWTRYAAHLLQWPALQALGYERALGVLDVSRPTSQYSHQLRCDTLLLALSAGKSRLYHTGELVRDEFATALGTGRYPQRSDLQAYLDRIVARDQTEAEQGVPTPERTVAQFVQVSQASRAQAAGPTVGQRIYLDAHVLPLHTAQAVARTKHGVWNRVVKALVQVRTVSATDPGRALTSTWCQGDVALTSQVETAVAQVTQATGTPVALVGADRGALSQAVLETFATSPTGLVVWADETPAVRQAAAALPRRVFTDGEYETHRRPDGQAVRRLQTRLADLPALAINAAGYRCRTVVVEDVQTRHRAAFHAVGGRTAEQPAADLLAFLRGKQVVEENFKQGRAWGADAFCGGAITAQVQRERPTAAEITTLRAQARHLKQRWQANLVEEGQAAALWRAGQVRKRQLNDLLRGIRRRRQRIRTAWQTAEVLIRWGQTGIVPPGQRRGVVDTRKLTILTECRDFIRQARRDTLAHLAQGLTESLVEEAIAARGGAVAEAERQVMVQEAKTTVQRLPWGQVGTRFLDQGGWVRQDPVAHVLHVTIKSCGPRLVQRACERLCAHLNSLAPVMHCADGDYTLHYACQPRPPG